MAARQGWGARLPERERSRSADRRALRAGPVWLFTVPTVTLQEARQHVVEHDGRQYLHLHQIQISGGVLVLRDLVSEKVADDSLHRSHSTILAARPPSLPAQWPFTFNANTSNRAVGLAAILKKEIGS